MSEAPALRHQVGRLFLVGLGSTQLDAGERAWLRMLRPSGFILFRRNIEDATEVTALLSAATKAAAGPDEQRTSTLRALDLEGGLVDRLRDLLAPMPSAASVAASRSKRDAALHGRLIGRAARLLGFNTTFAPVLDLALPQAAPVMRTRAYGQTAEDVIAYAAPFLEALRAERVLGCGKHFPGRGGGELDSHLSTPRIQRRWKQIYDEDLQPYRALMPLLPIIMVSHAAYPAVPEAGDTPASVSSFWIADILRKRLGFTGLVLSDDLEMGGILTQMSIEEAAVQALLAGTDLLETCKDPALIFRAYEAVLQEAERSAAFRKIVRTAWRRVHAESAKLLDPQLPRAATKEQLSRLRSDILVFSAEIEARERSVGNDTLQEVQR
jgi:beta-N-acetylhexosaminidase